MTQKLPQDQDATRGERHAGYVRVSTRRQADEGYSYPEQERRYFAFVESHGGTSAGLYADADTGTRNDRPEWQRMVRDAEAGLFDVLVITKIDRFGRNFRDSTEMKGRLEDAGVRIVAMDLGMDFSDGAGLLIWANMSAVAQMESQTIGRRVAESAEARARSGKMPSSRSPRYGYRAIRGGGYIVVTDQAAIVVRIFEQAAAGLPPTEITYRLNEDGIRTAEGAAWSRQNVRRLLGYPEYYGAVRYKGRVVCEQGEHEPIVDRELWDRAQVAMAVRAAAPSRGSGRKPSTPFLLRAKLKCGVCGGTLGCRSHQSGSGSYFCRRGNEHRSPCAMRPISRELVDGQVLDYFNRVGLDMEATKAAFVESTRRRIGEAAAVLAGAEHDHLQATADLARMRRYFHQGEIDPTEWRGHRDELGPQVGAAAAALERARAAHAAAVAGAELRDAEASVLRFLSELRRSIVEDVRDGSSFESVRAALDRLFEHFVVHDEDLLAERGLAPAAAHGWQSDLFAARDDGAVLYLEPVVRGVVIDGYEVPADLRDHAPAEAFPVLRRVAIPAAGDRAGELTRTG